MAKQKTDTAATDEASDPADRQTGETARTSPEGRIRRWLPAAGIVVVTGMLLAGGYIAYLYASTPLSIRQPLPEHYHFRLQVLVDGRAEDFGRGGYQEGYSKDNCTAALTASPIHFHDNRNQFVHIHWEGMTGGQVLKYYGWNFIGGTRGSLGYRFDEGQRLDKVPIHGSLLPAIPDDAAFHVYIKDGDGYKEKTFKDFTHQDLEVFFGRDSNFPAHKLNQQKRPTNLRDLITPKAHAHNDTGHSQTEAGHGSQADQAELTRLNNLIGDVVIFVQKDKPGDAQIKDRFNRLEPLGDSSCGG